MAVTVIVSLFTEPRPESQLHNLVWSTTPMPKGEPMPLWKKPIFWACGVAVFFAILQWIFW
jgi:hypothetical protein